MTVLVVIGILILIGLGGLVALGLCWSAAVGDQVRVEADAYDDLAVLDDDPERCAVCGDPDGVRCCEFGKAA